MRLTFIVLCLIVVLLGIVFAFQAEQNRSFAFRLREAERQVEDERVRAGDALRQAPARGEFATYQAYLASIRAAKAALDVNEIGGRKRCQGA